MDYVLIFLALVLCLAGLAGCILPGIPGPPLCLIALFLLQWAFQPFSVLFLVVWTLIVILISVIDYWLPLWSARKFGATRQGILGGLAGMLAGMFFTPIGMVAGLILGTILGDWLAGRAFNQAARSGIASAFGTLLTIGIKLIACGLMTFYTIWEAIPFLWLSFRQA